MTETETESEIVVAPCPTCRSCEFNSLCPDCMKMQEECWLIGKGIEGFDL